MTAGGGAAPGRLGSVSERRCGPTGLGGAPLACRVGRRCRRVGVGEWRFGPTMLGGRAARPRSVCRHVSVGAGIGGPVRASARPGYRARSDAGPDARPDAVVLLPRDLRRVLPAELVQVDAVG